MSWHKKVGRWFAYIKHLGKRHFLGYFDTPEEASAAYKEAASRLHTHNPEAMQRTVPQARFSTPSKPPRPPASGHGAAPTKPSFPYRCEHCGQWHVGQSNGMKRRVKTIYDNHQLRFT